MRHFEFFKYKSLSKFLDLKTSECKDSSESLGGNSAAPMHRSEEDSGLPGRVSSVISVDMQQKSIEWNRAGAWSHSWRGVRGAQASRAREGRGGRRHRRENQAPLAPRERNRRCAEWPTAGRACVRGGQWRNSGRGYASSLGSPAKGAEVLEKSLSLRSQVPAPSLRHSSRGSDNPSQTWTSIFFPPCRLMGFLASSSVCAKQLGRNPPPVPRARKSLSARPAGDANPAGKFRRCF